MVRHYKAQPGRRRRHEARLRRTAAYRAAVTGGAFTRLGHLLWCRVFDEDQTEKCTCGKWEVDREDLGSQEG